jgi:hypothetical protein
MRAGALVRALVLGCVLVGSVVSAIERTAHRSVLPLLSLG